MSPDPPRGEEFDEGHEPPLDVQAMTLHDLAVIALLGGAHAEAAREELARRGYVAANRDDPKHQH